jgi:hypothetical protein
VTAALFSHYRAYVAPEEGFEPPTRRLTAACSTTELLRKGEGTNR